MNNRIAWDSVAIQLNMGKLALHLTNALEVSETL
jgi:hypothetical protein